LIFYPRLIDGIERWEVTGLSGVSAQADCM